MQCWCVNKGGRAEGKGSVCVAKPAHPPSLSLQATFVSTQPPISPAPAAADSLPLAQRVSGPGRGKAAMGARGATTAAAARATAGSCPEGCWLQTLSQRPGQLQGLRCRQRAAAAAPQRGQAQAWRAAAVARGAAAVARAGESHAQVLLPGAAAWAAAGLAPLAVPAVVPTAAAAAPPAPGHAAVGLPVPAGLEGGRSEQLGLQPLARLLLSVISQRLTVPWLLGPGLRMPPGPGCALTFAPACWVLAARLQGYPGALPKVLRADRRRRLLPAAAVFAPAVDLPHAAFETGPSGKRPRQVAQAHLQASVGAAASGCQAEGEDGVPWCLLGPVVRSTNAWAQWCESCTTVLRFCGEIGGNPPMWPARVCWSPRAGLLMSVACRVMLLSACYLTTV